MSAKGPVYIVDDDDAVRDSLELLLSAAGYETLAFAAADAFLRHPREPGRGCLLSDIRMPGMSGIELLETVRDSDSACPVVLITGHGDVPLAVEAMKHGAADFIEKPFDDTAVDRGDRRGAGACRRFARRGGRGPWGRRARGGADPARATGYGRPGRRPLQQGDRARPRHQPAHGRGLSRQRNVEDAGREPRRTGADRDARGPRQALTEIKAARRAIRDNPACPRRVPSTI